MQQISGTVGVDFGEGISIPWTVPADLTGKRVVFAVLDPATNQRVLLKTSEADPTIVEVSQVSPTGAGWARLVAGDYGTGKLGNGDYVAQLWYEELDETGPQAIAKWKIIVSSTVPRGA